MKVVLLGGTKGIGRALGRLLAERSHTICLLGRNVEALDASARDMEVRAGSDQKVTVAECDLLHPEGFAAALDSASEKLGGLDTVVVTAALFATEEELEADTALAREVVTVNFANMVSFCEEARKRIMSSGRGTLCVLSSVAGERGRKPVIIYGASKAGLSAYLEGLDHKFRAQGLKTICVKPGFVKTGTTAGLDPPPFAGEPEEVAKDILKAIERGTPIVYTPGIWRYVMLVIRNLPRFVMRRISF